jgi:hypothetical protein
MRPLPSAPASRLSRRRANARRVFSAGFYLGRPWASVGAAARPFGLLRLLHLNDLDLHVPGLVQGRAPDAQEEAGRPLPEQDAMDHAGDVGGVGAAEGEAGLDAPGLDLPDLFVAGAALPGEARQLLPAGIVQAEDQVEELVVLAVEDVHW